MFVTQFYGSTATTRRTPVHFSLDDVMFLAFKRNPDDKRAVRVQCLNRQWTTLLHEM